MVTRSSDARRARGGAGGLSKHAHSWRITRQEGTLSEGVCKACGAHRDFVAGVRRWPASSPRPAQALRGRWLVDVEGTKLREVKMPSDEDEREAQRIALAELIRGCEDAVSELIRTINEDGDQSPATKRAREILAEMLASWRQTLSALTAQNRA